MYYLIKILDNGYVIRDSKTGREVSVRELDILNLINKGVNIKGVAMVNNELTFIPVSPLCFLGRVGLAKSKLVNGRIEVLDGFELESIGDGFIAKQLDRSIYNYLERNNIKSRFILSMPDVITDISDNFLCDCFDTVLYLCIDLPKSLKHIGQDAFASGFIEEIRFNGVVDEIESGSSEYRCTCLLLCNGFKDYNFRVKKLNSYSIGIHGRGSVGNIYLRDTVELGYRSIKRETRGIKVHLGRNIETISHFLNPFKYMRNCSTDSIMLTSDIIYLPDNCNLREVDLSYEIEIYDGYTAYHNSIVILSESMYSELIRRFNNGELVMKSRTVGGWLGLITYKNEYELNDLKENIGKYIMDYRTHFSNCLNWDNVNQIVRLELKRK